MKFENEGLDRETIDRLEKYGIFISKDALPMNKEKALVLIDEAMLNNLVMDFLSLWKNELFPNCSLRDYEASEKEICETIHPCKPWESGTRQDKAVEHSASCSNDCKEVYEKMDENIKDKLTRYLELLGEIKEKTSDEKTAVALLQEILKDTRMEQIRQERNFNGDTSATEKQVNYLRSFGVAIPDGLTRQQASRLIENAKAAIKYMQSAGKMTITVP